MFIVAVIRVAIVKATIFVTILEVTIIDARMLISMLITGSNSHGCGRCPVTGDPSAVRLIVAVRPGIPRPGVWRLSDCHGRGSAEPDSNRHPRRSH
jgi:hypothetical protein